MQSSQPVKLYHAQLRTELSSQHSQPQHVSEDKLAKTEAASPIMVSITLKYSLPCRPYAKTLEILSQILSVSSISTPWLR